MISLELPRLSSLGHALDLSPEAFGELRESNDILDDVAAQRARMNEDGYVFLRDFLDVDWVMDARREILRRLKEGGGLDPNHPDEEAGHPYCFRTWLRCHRIQPIAQVASK